MSHFVVALPCTTALVLVVFLYQIMSSRKMTTTRPHWFIGAVDMKQSEAAWITVQYPESAGPRWRLLGLAS
jgi:hypothetical protein